MRNRDGRKALTLLLLWIAMQSAVGQNQQVLPSQPELRQDSLVRAAGIVRPDTLQAVRAVRPDSIKDARKMRRANLKKHLIFGLTGVVLVTSALLFYNVRSK